MFSGGPEVLGMGGRGGRCEEVGSPRVRANYNQASSVSPGLASLQGQPRARETSPTRRGRGLGGGSGQSAGLARIRALSTSTVTGDLKGRG